MWKYRYYILGGIGVGGGIGAGVGAVGGGIPGAVVGLIIGGVTGGLTGIGVAALIAFLSPLIDAFKGMLNKYSDNYERLEKERKRLLDNCAKTSLLVTDLKTQLGKSQADTSSYTEKIEKYEELLKKKDLIIHEKEEGIDELLKNQEKAHARISQLKEKTSKLIAAYKEVSEELENLYKELEKDKTKLLSEDNEPSIRFLGEISEENLRAQMILEKELVLGKIAKNQIMAGWLDLENKSLFYRQLSNKISLEIEKMLKSSEANSGASKEKIILMCGYGKIFNRMHLMLNLLESTIKDVSTTVDPFEKEKKLEKVMHIMIAAFDLSEEEAKRVWDRDQDFVIKKISGCIEAEYQNAIRKINDVEYKQVKLSAQYNLNARLYEELCEKFEFLQEEYKDILSVEKSEPLCFYREMERERESFSKEEGKMPEKRTIGMQR